MTPEEWDSHYYRIREDLVHDGLVDRADGLAHLETTEQFGERPGGKP